MNLPDPYFSHRVVSKTLVSNGGRAGWTRRCECGRHLRCRTAGKLAPSEPEAPPTFEEADPAQRSPDGSFLHFAQVKATALQ